MSNGGAAEVTAWRWDTHSGLSFLYPADGPRRFGMIKVAFYASEVHFRFMSTPSTTYLRDPRDPRHRERCLGVGI